MEVNKEKATAPISKEDFISKIRLDKFSNIHTSKNALSDKSFIRPYINKFETSPMIKHTIVSIDIPSLDLQSQPSIESEK